jgi:hypothetical protein
MAERDKTEASTSGLSYKRVMTVNYDRSNSVKGPIIKLITAVIYSFRNKLERLFLNPRLGWKGLPGTNTLAYYGNRKLRP